MSNSVNLFEFIGVAIIL